MAPQDCDFQIDGAGMEWKLTLSEGSHISSTSPAFSLQGSDWHLDFIYLNRKNEVLVVALIPRGVGYGIALRTPFEVVTYLMRDPRDASDAALDLRWHRVAKRERVDFTHSHGVIRNPGQVRIVCLFHGAQPTMDSENLNGQIVPVSSEDPRHLESLSSDFSHLLEDEILPDARLECGGRTFRAHRSVLAARSRVFRAMFQNGMLESETGTVKVQDVDVAVLEKLLKYIYSGKPEEISEGTAADLYEAADKYEVHTLKSACAYWIVRNLTVENCVKYLLVADAHSDRDLKAAVVKFMVENTSALKSEAWFTFLQKPSELANEVFQAYIASTVP